MHTEGAATLSSGSGSEALSQCCSMCLANYSFRVPGVHVDTCLLKADSSNPSMVSTLPMADRWTGRPRALLRCPTCAGPQCESAPPCTHGQHGCCDSVPKCWPVVPPCAAEWEKPSVTELLHVTPTTRRQMFRSHITRPQAVGPQEPGPNVSKSKRYSGHVANSNCALSKTHSPRRNCSISPCRNVT